MNVKIKRIQKYKYGFIEMNNKLPKQSSFHFRQILGSPKRKGDYNSPN